MKKLLFLSIAFVTVQTAFAQTYKPVDPKEEKIIASYQLTFARMPRPDEIQYWKGQPDLSIEQHIENRRTWMTQNDKNELRGAILSSYAAIFGRTPKQQEMDYWMGQKLVYKEILGHNTSWLLTHQDEWDSVIVQSYRAVFKKEIKPTDQEFKYWHSQKAMPYWVLVKKHEDFKNSQSGYKVQSVDFSKSIVDARMLTNFQLAIVPFSYALQQQISKLLPENYVIATGGGNFVSTNTGNVIATGGGNVIATGGGNIITFGNGNVIATGGGNLIKISK